MGLRSVTATGPDDVVNSVTTTADHDYCQLHSTQLAIPGDGRRSTKCLKCLIENSQDLDEKTFDLIEIVTLTFNRIETDGLDL